MLPGWKPWAVALKAAALDRLYNTQHYGLNKALDRIMEVMAQPRAHPVAIVEAIAPLRVSDKEWGHCGLALEVRSLDHGSENLPMYDTWAVKAISYHFGGLHRPASSSVYRAFVRYVRDLRSGSCLSYSLRELDRYLWLFGMYRGWPANRRSLGEEVRTLFERQEQDSGIKQALSELIYERRE